MPIYEYHCNDCGKNFELLLFGNEKPECSFCKSEKVIKLLSACGFKSKGKNGATVKASAADSSCSGCTATSCSTCGSR